MARYRRIIAAEGNWGTVECVRRANGSRPAVEFLDELGEDAAVFYALFHEMAADGRTKNPDRFSHEAGKIYGFKQKVSNRQARFACFGNGNCWVLTHGFWKPGAQHGLGKWPPKEIDRANKLRNEYLKQTGGGK